MAPEPAPVWACALYMRLSVEDGDGAESASIINQRALLRAYAQQHGYPVCGEYIDDGYSGTSFDRPAIRRLLADAAAGRVNLILVKDLSRLGRNSARTSDLLDEFFPAHHVRFISVSDGYDSANLTNSMALATPLVTAMHEMYARDISGKIRAAFAVKIRQGQFIGSFAPFGYRKDPNNHNHLIADPQAAEAVRLMFAQALSGKTPAQIAALLDRRGLLPPLAYRRARTASGGPAGQSCWTASSVRKILKNPVYCGHMVQGKSQKPSFKSAGCLPLPRAQWVTVQDTHAPLIEPFLWQCVQQQISRRAPAGGSGFRNLFSGIARCADCGRCMSTVGSRKKGSAASLACGGYKQHGRQCCTNHHIAYETLYAAVLTALNRSLALAEGAREALAAQLAAGQRARAHDGSAARELRAVRQKLARLMDDSYSGRAAPDVYAALLDCYQRQIQALQIRADAALHAAEPSEQDYLRSIDALLHPKALDETLLHLYVDRILVHQKTDGPQPMQKLELWFRFACAPCEIILK